MKKVSILIIEGAGINCEDEMEAAYKMANGDIVDKIDINKLFRDMEIIFNYNIINFPGGFSFGDHLGSAKVLALKTLYQNGGKFYRYLKQFIKNGGYILGICNGFQFLVKVGFLPNILNLDQQEATLTFNLSGKFENRWCYFKIDNKIKTPFLKNIDKIELPVRHKEGRLIISKDIEKQFIENGYSILKYSDENFIPTDRYPLNPNGSFNNCAGIVDKTGHILGIMPHPEAFLTKYNHPTFNKDRSILGLKIFENIVEHIKFGG